MTNQARIGLPILFLSTNGTVSAAIVTGLRESGRVDLLEFQNGLASGFPRQDVPYVSEAGATGGWAELEYQAAPKRDTVGLTSVLVPTPRVTPAAMPAVATPVSTPTLAVRPTSVNEPENDPAAATESIPGVGANKDPV